MHLCYIDESGVSSIPGNTSHFVLAGLSIPIWHWKSCDAEISRIKAKYALNDEEIHTAWIKRPYSQQIKIPDFESLSYVERRLQVTILRDAELKKQKGSPRFKQIQKNFKHTTPYIHLTLAQRNALLVELATMVGGWGFARLFAECVDKRHFDPARSRNGLDEHSFEQVVSRFEKFLQMTEAGSSGQNFGLIIHDNNDTVAKQHTKLMRKFHRHGTFWTSLRNIIETPLFVDSQLTGMVQIADLCSYALRRYLENGELELFEQIFKRADRVQSSTVGVRHFTDNKCTCMICSSHKKQYND